MLRSNFAGSVYNTKTLYSFVGVRANFTTGLLYCALFDWTLAGEITFDFQRSLWRDPDFKNIVCCWEPFFADKSNLPNSILDTYLLILFLKSVERVFDNWNKFWLWQIPYTKNLFANWLPRSELELRSLGHECLKWIRSRVSSSMFARKNSTNLKKNLWWLTKSSTMQKNFLAYSNQSFPHFPKMSCCAWFEFQFDS